MQTVEPRYNEINTLTCDIIELLEQEQFEEVNLLLSQRLTLLKQLDEHVNSLTSNVELRPSYEKFLIELQAKDNIQLNFLLKEKSNLLAQSLLQKKSKQALSAYKDVKLG